MLGRAVKRIANNLVGKDIEIGKLADAQHEAATGWAGTALVDGNAWIAAHTSMGIDRLHLRPGDDARRLAHQCQRQVGGTLAVRQPVGERKIASQGTSINAIDLLSHEAPIAK